MANDYLSILEKYKNKAKMQSQKSVDIQNRISSAEKVQDFLSDRLEEEHDKQEQAKIQAKIEKSFEYEGRQSSLLEQQRQKDLFGSNKWLTSAISRTAGGMDSRLRSLRESPNLRMEAYSQLGGNSNLMEKSILSARSNINTLSESMGNLIGPNGITDEEKYKAHANKINSFESSIARNQLSIQYQRQAGKDPASVLSSANTISERAESMLLKDSINLNAKAGTFGDLSTESNNLTKKLKALSFAINELNKSTDEERHEKKKAVDEAKKNVENQMDVVGAVRSNGGGGKAGDFNQIGAILKDFSKIASSFSSGYGAIAIDNPLRIMGNQTSFMDKHNERYSSMQKMTQGDQMSLLKNMGMYGGAKDYTEKMFGKANTYMGSKVASAGLNLAGDTALAAGKVAGAMALTAATGGAATPLVAAAGLSGFADISSGISGLSTISSDYRNNIKAGEISLNAYNKNKALFESMNQIPASQMQAYENQYRRSYTAGTGLGINSAMERNLNDFSSGSMMDQLAGLNISQEKASMLTQLAGKTIGGRDMTSGALVSAAKAEKAGVVSAEQYTQLLGGMTDVGGGNKDLYNIMKSAITIGMDDSKNISRMVSATVSIADKSSVTGVIASEGIGESVLRASSFGDSLMTASQRSKVGASQASKLSNLYSRGGTDIYSLQELAGITEAVKGTDVTQAGRINLEKADLSLVSSIGDLLGDKKSTRYKKAVESVEREGLSGLVGNDDVIKRVLAVKNTTAVSRILGMTPEISDKGREFILGSHSYGSKIKSFEDFKSGLSAKDYNEWTGRTSGQEMNAESLFNMSNRINIKKSLMSPSVSRAVKNSKFATQGQREFWESKKGVSTILDKFGYDKWNEDMKTQSEIAIESKGTSPDVKYNANHFIHSTDKERKEQFLIGKQSQITSYMKSASGKEVYKDNKEREDDAGRNIAPGAIIAAGKEFTSAAEIFGTTVNGDFKKAIGDFKAAIDSMNSKSSRPNNDSMSGEERDNLVRENSANSGKLYNIGRWK